MSFVYRKLSLNLTHNTRKIVNVSPVTAVCAYETWFGLHDIVTGLSAND